MRGFKNHSRVTEQTCFACGRHESVKQLTAAQSQLSIRFAKRNRVATFAQANSRVDGVRDAHTENGWFIPPPAIGDPGTDYKIRAVVARVGLTANTPEEAVYLDGMLDADGNRLTGAKRYTMTFKQLPPFHEPSFWALRMFDAKNSYPVPNSLNRYVLGSDYPNMKKNPDGSLTIYLQAENPGPDKEANWLPTPRGPSLYILGTSAPGQALIDCLSDPSAYTPPPAVVVK